MRNDLISWNQAVADYGPDFYMLLAPPICLQPHDKDQPFVHRSGLIASITALINAS